jgi:hypothetical protein
MALKDAIVSEVEVEPVVSLAGEMPHLSDEDLQSLTVMFDAAARLRYVQLAIWELHTPGAEYVLMLWCSAKGHSIDRMPLQNGGQVINCTLNGYRGQISVYLEKQ